MILISKIFFYTQTGHSQLCWSYSGNNIFLFCISHARLICYCSHFAWYGHFPTPMANFRTFLWWKKVPDRASAPAPELLYTPHLLWKDMYQPFLFIFIFLCTCVRVCVCVWGFWVYLFWSEHNSVWQPGLLLSRRFQQTSVPSGNSTHTAILSYCWFWQGVVFLSHLLSPLHFLWTLSAWKSRLD